jgi:hypothetical protein
MNFQSTILLPSAAALLCFNAFNASAAVPSTAPDELPGPSSRRTPLVITEIMCISQVQHSPVLPAAYEPVLISAQVHDPDGVAAVTLRYRIDPATNVFEIPMLDTGADGDLVANDGLFSAVIPGQKGMSMIAYSISSLDNSVAPETSLYPSDAPERECLVRVGEPRVDSQFGVYRIWMTRKTYLQPKRLPIQRTAILRIGSKYITLELPPRT